MKWVEILKLKLKNAFCIKNAKVLFITFHGFLDIKNVFSIYIRCIADEIKLSCFCKIKLKAKNIFLKLIQKTYIIILSP